MAKQTVPDEVEDDDEGEPIVGAGTFGQGDVNMIVRSRVQRLRGKYQTQLADATAKSEEAAQAAQQATERLALYEKVFASILEDKVKGLPDGIKKLLAGLAPAEQLQWLQENEVPPVEHKTPPVTPKPGEAHTDPSAVQRSKAVGSNYTI